MTVRELIEQLEGFDEFDRVELVESPIVNDEDHDVYEVEEVQVRSIGPRCRILFTVRQG